MRKSIVVLGVGLVGRAIAIDLAQYYQVTAVDVNPASLTPLKKYKDITTLCLDLNRGSVVKSLVKDFDVVVGALPGFMGYGIVKEVIEAGRDMVDISFFSEDPFGLDQLARDNDVTVVTDCGVAPGMGNLILGYHNENMHVDSFKCLVGGLPKVREWPWEYKAVFSPLDVIEEYLRPARYIQNGRLVIRDALSDSEKIYFEDVGTLEAWNSDGLRSLLHTMKVPNMIEKTLRYPGSTEFLKVLRDTGYFSYNQIDIKGQKVRPIDVTSKLLFEKWHLQPHEREFTIMRICIEGVEKGVSKRYIYTLYDEFDDKSDTTSMARTTGYVCNAVVNLLMNGMYSRKGISPPEYVGCLPEHFNFVMDYLKKRNVIYKVTQEEIL